ncbi:MAG TPA: ABC transporter transmembrane domain-containing protein, partial [Dehalococcoidia bacterium]|nr:ABC transporter transmembrane domain-containing protein [Dehalococcoidia bacterium]
MWEKLGSQLRPVAATDGLVDAAPGVSIRHIFRRFWPDIRPSRGLLCISLFLIVLTPVLAAAEIWMFKILVDDVLTPRDFAAFPTVAAAFVGLALLGGAVSFTGQYLTTWIGEHFVQRMRTRVFAHLHSLSVTFFDRRR